MSVAVHRAGPRIDEALSLRWRDVNLPGRTLRVACSKTDAGHRAVDLLPTLADELGTTRARSGAAPGALVFPTSTGEKQSPSNVGNRLMAKAAEKANVTLAEAGRPPAPRAAVAAQPEAHIRVRPADSREPVPYVMEQAGHTSPTMTLGIYARVMRRTEDETRRLQALVDGGSLLAVSARFGAEAADDKVIAASRMAADMPELAL